MNKIFFLLIFTKSFYAMELDWISTERVVNFLENNMALETKVYFNAESKSKNKLNINIRASQSYPFFFMDNDSICL